MIKEIIVVEGRDDVTAVKRAVNAEVIAVHGFGMNADSIHRIQTAGAQRGVIVLTDPDHAGESIRKRIEAICPEARHAYIMRKEGMRKGDIGVENASPEAIRRALTNAHASSCEARHEFTTKDLLAHGLMGAVDAKERRQELGKHLGIGYGSASTLLSRLNNYGISREDFERAAKKLDERKQLEHLD